MRAIRIAILAVIAITVAAYSPFLVGYVGPGTQPATIVAEAASWAIVKLAPVWSGTLNLLGAAGPAFGETLPARSSSAESGAPIMLAQAAAPAKPSPAGSATANATPAKPSPAGAAGTGPAQTGSVPQAATPASAAPSLSQGDLVMVVTLLRNTLVALHQANLTGNYTVLRDLGAPSFRDANSATKLAEVFAPVRTRNIDLSTVVVLDPHLTLAKINEGGMLDVAGSLTTTPVPVNFELLFQSAQNSWKLFGISIGPDNGPDTAAASPKASGTTAPVPVSAPGGAAAVPAPKPPASPPKP